MTYRRLSRLPLGSLAAFEAAARYSSFKEAALELGVTSAAISHQIKALEIRLGVSLFDRLHRSVRLTRVGKAMGTVMRKSFDSIECVLSSLGQQGLIAGAETLRVSAAPTFAGKWLAPRLHRFQALHPAMELHLLASDTLVDLAHDRRVDVLVRYGAKPKDRRVRSIRLWAEGRLVAVCSPALKRGYPLQSPKDVLKYSLLRTALPYQTTKQRGTKGTDSGWNAWLNAAGVAAHAPPPGPLFGTTQLALEAATSGRGFALAPDILVREDLNAGTLVQPFSTTLRDPFSFWLVFRVDRAEESKIRAFRAWIFAELQR